MILLLFSVQDNTKISSIMINFILKLILQLLLIIISVSNIKD